MFQTNTLTYPSNVSQARLCRLSPTEPLPVRGECESELAIDDALAGSFPASDPPAWNPGIARPTPVETSRENDIRPSAARADTAPTTPGVIDMSRSYGSERTLLQALTALAGAAGIALLVPFVVLLAGLPIALAGRGLLEVLAWLFPALR